MGTNAMKNKPLWIAISIIAAVLSACGTVANTKDVDQFVDDRDLCDHMRGEFPEPGSDPERIKEVEDGINKACQGMDARLAMLNAKYAQNPDIMQKLSQYEVRIERKRR